MLASGMAPVLHLVAFRRKDLRSGASITTRGLALFAGQELEARIPSGWTVAEMVRRLSRLALDMMLNGPVHTARTMRGLDAGEWIDLLPPMRSEEHTSELQSLMRISYAVFCLKTKKNIENTTNFKKKT